MKGCWSVKQYAKQNPSDVVGVDIKCMLVHVGDYVMSACVVWPVSVGV